MIEVHGECELDDCPPGLFLFDKNFGMMTEYSTTKYENGRAVGNQRDAYVVESGEYFVGGAPDWRGRGKLRVSPITLTLDGDGT